MSLLEMADATPDTRDRYVDFLRAVSIMVVVLGHWLIAVIYWRNGEISGQNALDVVPGLWLATWILQVMPIFFFVGGFSNMVTMDAVARRGGGYAGFIHGRVTRLMRPTILFLAIWIPVALFVDLFTNLGDDVLGPAGTLLTRPLWFLGIYMIMIAFAPAMIRLHRKFGMKVLVAMAGGAIFVDIGAVGFDIESVGYLNFAFVWLFVHQLGFFYGDGSIGRLRRGHFWILAVCGLAVLVALTASEIYSPSMVGLRNERSNTNPPSVVIVALTLWQLGLVMLLRDQLSRRLARRRVWATVIGLNAVIMTMFLWHQTAMLIVVGALYPLGFPQPAAGSAGWWALRPAWVLALAVCLALLVMMLGRFERERRRGGPSEVPKSQSVFETVVAAVGATYVLLGVLGFAVSGLDGFAASKGDLLVMLRINPILNVVHLTVGGLLMGATVRGIGRTQATAFIGAVGFATLGAVTLLFLTEAGSANFLAVNGADGFLYLATAAVLLVVQATPRRASSSSAPVSE